jgi:hypothetical protein
MYKCATQVKRIRTTKAGYKNVSKPFCMTGFADVECNIAGRYLFVFSLYPFAMKEMLPRTSALQVKVLVSFNKFIL